MNAGVQENCRKSACKKSIPPVLSKEQLCLDHFLDESFARTDNISRRCEEQKAIRSVDLEWLLEDALLIVTSLEADSNDMAEEQRERMMELLLNLANLHEFVAQPSVRREPS